MTKKGPADLHQRAELSAAQGGKAQQLARSTRTSWTTWLFCALIEQSARRATLTPPKRVGAQILALVVDPLGSSCEAGPGEPGGIFAGRQGIPAQSADRAADAVGFPIRLRHVIGANRQRGAG